MFVHISNFVENDTDIVENNIVDANSLKNYRLTSSRKQFDFMPHISCLLHELSS